LRQFEQRRDAAFAAQRRLTVPFIRGIVEAKTGN